MLTQIPCITIHFHIYLNTAATILHVNKNSIQLDRLINVFDKSKGRKETNRSQKQKEHVAHNTNITKEESKSQRSGHIASINPEKDSVSENIKARGSCRQK